MQHTHLEAPHTSVNNLAIFTDELLTLYLPKLTTVTLKRPIRLLTWQAEDVVLAKAEGSGWESIAIDYKMYATIEAQRMFEDGIPDSRSSHL